MCINTGVTMAIEFWPCYFYVYSLNYYITLNLALFYQSHYKCEWNPNFLVNSLRKNISLLWPNGRCWVKFSTVFISLGISYNILQICFLLNHPFILTSRFLWRIPRFIRLWRECKTLKYFKMTHSKWRIVPR